VGRAVVTAQSSEPFFFDLGKLGAIIDCTGETQLLGRLLECSSEPRWTSMWQAWRPPDVLPLLARRSLDPGLVWATVALAALLLLSAIAVVLVNRWRRRDDSCAADGSLDYQSLFEQGLLSREELERIRGGRQKPEAATPTSSAASAQMEARDNAAETRSSAPDASSVNNQPPTGAEVS